MKRTGVLRVGALLLFLASGPIAERAATGQAPDEWTEPTVYRVAVTRQPAWSVSVTARFPHTPDKLHFSDWSSFAHEDGWSALVDNAVVVDDGEERPLTFRGNTIWDHGRTPGDRPLEIRYSIRLERVFKAYAELPKTTAPWSDGLAMSVPGFTLFMHAKIQGPFQVEYDLAPGLDVDTGWRARDTEHSFEDHGVETLLQNTMVIGEYEAAEINAGGFHVSAIPLGRHREGIDHLTPVMQAHARRFQSLFEYPSDERYIIVLIDDAWETGESFGNSYAMAKATPIRFENRPAWGKTMAHELFHYWNGWRMESSDWAATQWFSEGFTDYMASRAMIDGGFMTEEDLFDEMQKHVSFYSLFKQGLVYKDFSLIEAGSEKTTHNAALYDGGWLAGFCIDVLIREHSSNASSIDTLFKRLWEQHAQPSGGGPYTNDAIFALVSDLGGSAARDFLEGCVRGKRTMPLRDFFSRAGLVMIQDAQTSWVRVDGDAGPGAVRIRKAIAGVGFGADSTDK